ncbi:hypothetical protein [Amycolatopsis suaedae]|uniref:Uncharacterized protein n=1 Tax=Amycolatopsis suaedae TaxID=2510978 RepID=A0A4Q7J9F1_9PSEU|nr:hypothetical protein [Amycolatopsis suaedae]RZQ63849.1 hypothetical protein EWH70_11870 [Amycolatopsis suaedae]
MSNLVDGTRAAGGVMALGALTVFGALSLRRGFQGPRYVLTLLGIVGLVSIFGLTDTPANVDSGAWLVVVIFCLLSGSSVAATILMWLPEASLYVRRTRQGYQENRTNDR